MKYGSIILGFTMFVAIFVFTPNTIFSAFKINDGDINIEILPENPEPYADVTIKLSSFATDLNRANIDWKINGKTVLAGTGRTSYSFETQGPNTITTIDVGITPVDGISVNKQVTVRTSEIEMLWQAIDSHTPAFYKGKALPIQEGRIRVVAFPNTVNVSKANKKTLVYGWSRNNSAVQSASGFGKDSFTFTNNVLVNTENIKVSASNTDNSFNAIGNLRVNISQPKLVFYKKSPINGVLYDEALVGSATMIEDEMTVVAEPYFMNRNSSDLIYNWKINNNLIDTPSKRTELTIRPSSRGGYATVGLSIESATKLFQSVANNIKINL
jgi:hypothetical protein